MGFCAANCMVQLAKKLHDADMWHRGQEKLKKIVKIQKSFYESIKIKVTYRDWTGLFIVGIDYLLLKLFEELKLEKNYFLSHAWEIKINLMDNQIWEWTIFEIPIPWIVQSHE